MSSNDSDECEKKCTTGFLFKYQVPLGQVQYRNEGPVYPSQGHILTLKSNTQGTWLEKFSKLVSHNWIDGQTKFVDLHFAVQTKLYDELLKVSLGFENVPGNYWMFSYIINSLPIWPYTGGILGSKLQAIISEKSQSNEDGDEICQSNLLKSSQYGHNTINYVLIFELVILLLILAESKVIFTKFKQVHEHFILYVNLLLFVQVMQCSFQFL